MNLELRDGVSRLLSETASAHQHSFIATDGADPDWPIWYADHSRESFAERFGMKFSRSQLIYCLMNANYEHEVRSSDTDWSDFYADEIVERYAPSESPAEDTLALYYFDGCPFCSMVRSIIDKLGVEVELRDIFKEPHNRDDLVKARGRATVPVLRITSASGEDRWMPESRDIVHYLQENYD